MARNEDRQFGKYTLVRLLGRGGMAEVFLAKASGPAEVEKQVVIKRIHPDLCRDPMFVNMFIDEARISVLLRHGNIVPVFDFGKVEDQYYLAMEFVDGVTLAQLFKACRRKDELLPIDLSLFIAIEVCKGLHHAHHLIDPSGQPLRIVHRDVSPQNVMLSYEGEVKLFDFGIARAASRTTRTQFGVVKGKYRYMSPEQARGLPVAAASDIFSAGSVLFEMLAGRPLFDAENPSTLIKKVQAGVVSPPFENDPMVSPELDRILMKALARDPGDRYDSAADLGNELTLELHRRSPAFLPRSLSTFVQRICPPDQKSGSSSVEVAKGSTLAPTVASDAFSEPSQDRLPLPNEVPASQPEATYQAAAAAEPHAEPLVVVAETVVKAPAPPPERPPKTPGQPSAVAPSPRSKGIWILALALLAAGAAAVLVFQGTDSQQPQEGQPSAQAGGIKPKHDRHQRPPPAKKPNQDSSVTTMLGTVQIYSEPAADVIWKSQVLGRTPLTNVKLPAGNQVLKLVNLELGLKKSVLVEVKSGQTTSTRVLLRE